MAASDDSPPKKHHINLTNVVLDSFLACLLLLLIVSCSVLLRSFLVRRRVRRQVREALEAGFEIDEHGNIVGQRHKPKPLGEKPMMWEVWLDEKGNVAESQDITLSKDRYSEEWKEEESGPWQGILVLQPAALYSTPNPSLVSHSEHPHEHTPSAPLHTPAPSADKLEVSVLISMPNPHRRFAHGQANANYAMSARGKEKVDPDEGEVPDLLFGVTHVGIRP